MVIKNFDVASGDEAIRFLPTEYHSAFKKNLLSGAVAYFAGRPVGEVAWKKADETGELLSIFVAPEARRLGAGTGLLGQAILDMQNDGLKEIHFKFGDYGDRTALLPFFNDSGFYTDVDELPLGKKTISEIRDAIYKKGVDKAGEEGVCLFDLDGMEKAAVRNALFEVCGIDLDIYDRQWPGTYVILEDKKVRAAAFLREENDKCLSLDYLFNHGSPKDLACLMENIIKRVSEYYPDDTVVEMLLATSSGEKLYEAMFGEADSTFRMASCRQSFDLL